MRPLKRFIARFLNCLAGRRGDERLREEIELHVAMQAEENRRTGMTPRRKLPLRPPEVRSRGSDP